MLKNQSNQAPIAVRLYENKAYGTTYGKGLYRKALYNGTVEAIEATETYLVDFYNYEDWSNMARTDGEMEILANVTPTSNALYSWVKHYDRETRDKQTVPGFCELDTINLGVNLLICDEAHGIVETWRLNARPCKQTRTGIKSPQLLATNADLGGM